MKSIEVVECRKCSQQYYSGDGVSLDDGDMVELVVRFIPKCSGCMNPQGRSGPSKGGSRARHM